jgi:hypothetical protein
VAGVVVRAGVREVMVVAAGRTTVGVVVATGMDVVTVLADVAGDAGRRLLPHPAVAIATPTTRTRHIVVTVLG